MSLDYGNFHDRKIDLPLPITGSKVSDDFNFLAITSHSELTLINFDSATHLGSVLITTDSSSDQNSLTKEDLPVISSVTFHWSSSSIYLTTSLNTIVVLSVDRFAHNQEIMNSLNLAMPEVVIGKALQGYHCRSIGFVSTKDGQSLLSLSFSDVILFFDLDHLGLLIDTREERPPKDPKTITIEKTIGQLIRRSHSAPSLVQSVRINRIVSRN
ncbi:hypothetical protein GEMRC1_011835 [Eukaryota sp. GEM-RC1]